MKTYFAFILLLLLVLMPKTGSAEVVHKDSIPMQVDEHAEYFYLIQKGIASIMNGDTHNGISLLNQGIEMKNQVDNKNRVFEYFELEFSSLVGYMHSKSISPEEFDLGIAFLKEVFLSDKQKIHPEIVTRIQAFAKKHPKSEFALRLEIYCMDNVANVNLLEKKLARLLKMNPDLTAANIYEGKILYYMQHFPEAIQYLSNAIKTYPEYALAYQFRGLCYNNMNNLKNAMNDFNEAIRLYPTFADAYSNRGILKTQLNKKEEAIADFRRAIAINPNTEWPYNNIGLVYASNDMTDSALFYFQEALDINPEFEQAYENMGRLYYGKHDYGQAIHYFTKCISMSSDNMLYYNERGDAYFYDDKKEEAIANYEKALEMNANNSYSLMRIGDCYQVQKQYDQAILYYDRAINAQPAFKFAYVDKALCYSFLNKNDEAKEALLKAVKIDSTYSPALGNLGWIYYCLGDFKNCITYSWKAIHYEENAYYAMFNIALATLRLGKIDESKALYKKYVNLSRSKGDTVSQGAIDDLKDLIHHNIMVDQANDIIKSIFETQN